MHWVITYYDISIQEEILAMPAGFLGRYLRYSDRMELYGPDLGMPHTRAMGNGLFELRIKAAEGIARVFYQMPRSAPSITAGLVGGESRRFTRSYLAAQYTV
jgi:phage-related protein